ncbi:MAG: ankyrin repeat domain-containing protein [Candidatus Manganitrophaceae bacterium]
MTETELFFDAVVAGDAGKVDAFLEKNRRLADAFSPDGFTPLGLAAFLGQKEVVERLLEHGADPNAPSKNAARAWPLHSALAHPVREISLSIAKMLVARGGDVNAQQAGGWTPLHQAAIHGQIDLAEFLLDHDADPNAKADNGKTPLMMAMIGKHREMTALLQKHGVRGASS